MSATVDIDLQNSFRTANPMNHSQSSWEREKKKNDNNGKYAASSLLSNSIWTRIVCSGNIRLSHIISLMSNERVKFVARKTLSFFACFSIETISASCAVFTSILYGFYLYFQKGRNVNLFHVQTLFSSDAVSRIYLWTACVCDVRILYYDASSML